jgi:membrane-bound lytic murein transglycosylase D
MMQKSKAYYLVPISALVLFCLLLLSGTGQKQSTIGGAAGGSLHVPSIPSEIDFAGEKVPRGEYDLMERLDRELLVNTFWHSNTILMLKRTNRYFPVIEPILKKHGVPDDFKYLCMIESGLANVVSPSNAAGFWQFLESTGKKYGLEINEEIDERYHLEKATEAACRYLKDNKARLGSWTLAAAAYNMGENGVERQLKAQGVTSYYDLHLNTETSRYLFRILAAKEIFSDPVRYGFIIQQDQLYPAIGSRYISIDSAVASWPELALDQGTNYKHLKLLNPWIRKTSLKNRSRITYTVALPKNSRPGTEHPEIDPDIPPED